MTGQESLIAALPTFRVAFLRRGHLLTVALVEAEDAEQAVQVARRQLTLGETLDIQAIEVELAHRSVRELLDG